MRLSLISAHVALVSRGAIQWFVALALVGTGFWRVFATALNAFPAGLGVDFSYRPDRSIPTPMYEALRAVGYLRGGLAGASRGVSSITGPHQRAAFRIDGYLLGQRRRGDRAIPAEPVD